MQQEAVGDGGKKTLFGWGIGSWQPYLVGEYFAKQHLPSAGQNVVVFPH
jgi:hypothetical protein|tara:strand:+ start:353 stop:499 length:147 start_codon:yes stop_codon:yes gene_type:complete